MPTVIDYKNYIRTHKEANCPAYSKLRKAELKRVAKSLGYVEEEKKTVVKPTEEKKTVVKPKPVVKKTVVKSKPPSEMSAIELSLTVRNLLDEWKTKLSEKVTEILKPLIGQKGKSGYAAKLNKVNRAYNENIVYEMQNIYRILANKLTKYQKAANDLGVDISIIPSLMHEHFMDQNKRVAKFKLLTKPAVKKTVVKPKPAVKKTVIKPKPPSEMTAMELALTIKKLLNEWKTNLSEKVSKIVKPLNRQKGKSGYEVKLNKAIRTFNADIVKERANIFNTLIDKLTKYQKVATEVGLNLPNVLVLMNNHFKAQIKRVAKFKLLTKAQKEAQKIKK